MEALFAQFSLMANQALDNKDFDARKLDDLLDLFEREAHAISSSAEATYTKAARDAESSMREAEDYLNSLMDAAMDDVHQSYDEIDRSSTSELSQLVGAADAVEKMGRSIGSTATGAAKRYMDGAMKSAFATSKVHPF